MVPYVFFSLGWDGILLFFLPVAADYRTAVALKLLPPLKRIQQVNSCKQQAKLVVS